MLKTGRSTLLWTALALACVVGCASSGSSSQPPRRCVEEQEWIEYDLLVVERYADCVDPDRERTAEVDARCQRERYLEARCFGINAYRDALREGR